MKFQVLDIIPHLKNPVTGEIVSTAERLNQVVETARRAASPDAAGTVTADHANYRRNHAYAH